MLNLVVALPCEAKPIRRYYDLTTDTQKYAFPVYRSDNVRLVVSGAGKVNAAAAAAYLGSLNSTYSGAWLNIGIAGHASRKPGDVILVNRITDLVTGTSWYPPIAFRYDGLSGGVCTVDVPETGYKGDCTYDMEAAGFYPVATRFATGELVQCVKVISDNNELDAKKLNAAVIEEIIADKIDGIACIVQSVLTLSQENPTVVSTELCGILGQWHFTVSQRNQLSRLLQACDARNIGFSKQSATIAGCTNASDVLTCIEKRLQASSLALFV